MKVVITTDIKVNAVDRAALKEATPEQLLATARLQGAAVTAKVEPSRKPSPKKVTEADELDELSKLV